MYGYKAVLDDGSPNPVTEGQFTTNVVINYCKELVRSYEVQQAAEAARQSALGQAQQDLDNAEIGVEVV